MKADGNASDALEVSRKFFIGGHISASGGVEKAPERASVFGFITFQFFTKNQMRWQSPPLNADEVQSFIQEMKKFGIQKVMVHASYLINLASSDPELRDKSLKGLRDEIERCNDLGAAFLTLHPGSSKDRKKGLELVNNALSSVDPGNVTILVENMAGQGNVLGSTMEELEAILRGLDGKFGVCIDTCHAWASGYDIKSRIGYEDFVRKIDETTGTGRVMGFHLNDSKKGIGSRVDRHELIGKGTIGDGLINVIEDSRFVDSPKIMETPFGEEMYMENLLNIREMINESEESGSSDHFQ